MKYAAFVTATLMGVAACDGGSSPAPTSAATGRSPLVDPAPGTSETTAASAAPSAAPSPGPSATMEPASAAKPVRLAFVGDLAMSLHVGHYLTRRDEGKPVPEGVDADYPFTHVKARLSDADVALGNLECVVSPKGVKTANHNPFRAPLQSIAVLKAAGIDVVSVGNNHALDFGPVAFADMLERLDREGLPAIGRAVKNNGQEAPHVVTVRGVRIGLIGFYERPLKEQVADVVLARPTVDILIAFEHWGRENVSDPTPGQRKLGKALIDAGADAVIGTHAHVLQAEEWYKGKLLFHGLSNFVFSGMSFDEAHRAGGILELDVSKQGVLKRRFYRTRLDGIGMPHIVDGQPSDPPRLPDSEPVPEGLAGSASGASAQGPAPAR